MTYWGYVTDATDELTPIVGATVTIKAGSSTLARVAADDNGYFAANTVQPADTITISSAGYKPASFPASPYQQRFELERNTLQLPPVVVHAPPVYQDPRNQLPRFSLKTGIGIGLALLALLTLTRSK